MIDLHMHTKYSDGTWSVEETLRKAQKIGLNTISITDHDSVAAHRELADNDAYKSIFTGKIIPGVEFSTSYDGVAVHMLAYDFDYTKLEDFLEIASVMKGSISASIGFCPVLPSPFLRKVVKLLRLAITVVGEL